MIGKLSERDSLENKRSLCEYRAFPFSFGFIALSVPFFVSVLHRTDAASQGAVELPTAISLSLSTGRCLISWDGVTLDTALLSTGRLDYSARTSTNSARMSTGRLDYCARTSMEKLQMRECCQGYNCPLILVGFCSK